MNDNTNQSPEPTTQPVSIHGQSQHHGALPFIAAMLGVFLVIETIVLVYVVTTYVAVDNAKQQVVENRQEIVQQVKERVKDRAEQNDANQDDGFWSHLVFDGESRELKESDETTWMQTRLVAEDQAGGSCVGVYSMVDASQLKGFGVGSAGLFDPEVRAALGDRVSDAGVTNLGNVLDELDYSLFKVCQSETEDYVILLDSSNTVATLASYADTSGYWQLYQPVRGVMDGAVSLWFDVLSKTPVLSTGYGDAGWVNWNYWAPTEYLSMQLVESCSTRIADNGETPIYDARVLTCEIEYVK